jgi:hypothetical protein
LLLSGYDTVPYFGIVCALAGDDAGGTTGNDQLCDEHHQELFPSDAFEQQKGRQRYGDRGQQEDQKE